MGEQRANSALAARRHSDNHDIALFERDFLDNFVNDFIANLLVLPQLACRLRLSDEHGQAAYMGNAELFGLKHEAVRAGLYTTSTTPNKPSARPSRSSPVRANGSRSIGESGQLGNMPTGVVFTMKRAS